MKDQYFGDLGDYKKFSLLKTLRDKGGLRIAVHWVKTKNDGRKDGGRIAYLDNPTTWDLYDKHLFEFLKACVRKNHRKLSFFENSKHARDFRFFNDYIEDTLKRKELHEKLLKDKSSGLVFFDPDNGIEVKSMNQRNRHKYIWWTEIETAHGSGKDVLVYQHFPREKHKTFIQRKLTEIKSRFSAKVSAIEVEHSVYFLIAQKRHWTQIGRALKNYGGVWKSRVSITDRTRQNNF